jgi:hypothetical protein
LLKTRADLTNKDDDLSTKIKGILMLDCEIGKTPNAKTFSKNFVIEKIEPTFWLHLCSNVAKKEKSQ